MNDSEVASRGKKFLSFLESAPRVAASFWTAADGEALSELISQGLEIAELRMDLAPFHAIEEDGQNIMSGYSRLPRILTIRMPREGGQWQGDESLRYKLFLQLLPMADAVDVELAADICPQVVAAAKRSGAAVILSRHNFDSADSFAEIDRAAERAFANGADVFKTACMINSETELAESKKFLQKRKGEMIVVIGMGQSEATLQARRKFAAAGSKIAFAAASAASAPGQLSISETAQCVRG